MGERVKWVWFILLPLSLDAQCLKPGIYHDLRTNEPITLDTGNYTFVGLRMTDLGPGTWLNASKARKVELIHCTFEGKDEGTAVLSSGDITVSHCTFAQMEEGILQASPPGSKRKVAITSNVFRDNLVSVRLEVEKAEESVKRGIDRNKDPNTEMSAFFVGENTQQRRWIRRPTKARILRYRLFLLVKTPNKGDGFEDQQRPKARECRMVRTTNS